MASAIQTKSMKKLQKEKEKDKEKDKKKPLVAITPCPVLRKKCRTIRRKRRKRRFRGRLSLLGLAQP